MNVAIPLFATRVSPRFDCAQTVLLVEAADGQCSNRQEIVFTDLAPHEKINRLIELGVDTVVCGGIDRWAVEALQSAGVKIFAFTTGEVENALSRLLDGSLFDGNPIGEVYPPSGEMPPGVPGCFGRGRRGRGGGMNRGLGGRGPFGMQGRRRDD